MTRSLSEWAILAEAGHASVDHARIAFAHNVGADAQPFAHARPKRIDEDVGLIEQAEQ